MKYYCLCFQAWGLLTLMVATCVLNKQLKLKKLNYSSIEDFEARVKGLKNCCIYIIRLQDKGGSARGAT